MGSLNLGGLKCLRRRRMNVANVVFTLSSVSFMISWMISWVSFGATDSALRCEHVRRTESGRGGGGGGKMAVRTFFTSLGMTVFLEVLLSTV